MEKEKLKKYVDMNILAKYEVSDNIINYPKVRYLYGEEYSNTEVDLNKITKRLIYGDEYFGRTESDMYGRKAYNGNNTTGIINKLNNGWLENRINYWKQFIINFDNFTAKDQQKHKKQLDRYYKLYYSLLQWLDGDSNYIYQPSLENTQENFKFLLPFLKEFDLPRAILYECIMETFNEKFGKNSTEDVDYIKVKNTTNIEKEVVRL